MLRLSTALAALLLAGCASAPLVTTFEREAMRGFEMNGRFSLRVEEGERPAQSASGRLDWVHQPPENRLLIANPLGHAVAELSIDPVRSRLQLADGSRHESDDPEALLASVTGRRLPVTRIPDWLLGRGNLGAQRLDDAFGRPLELRENDWQIDYAYDEDRPGAPPTRLTIRRNGDLELRLRIEEWKALP